MPEQTPALFPCTECAHPGGIRVTKQGVLYSHDRPEQCPGSRRPPSETGACSECTHPSTPVTKEGVLQDHNWGVKCPGSGRPPAGGTTPEPSARDRLIWLKPWDWSMHDIAQLIDAYRDEVRREAAETVRGRRLRTVVSYSDERVNRALERAAIKVERGEE
ncbi:hypothetical protein DMA15_03685 [Streptomyces sp. WAC 01529]|uniref:hypothetical protein n=1 Tax=Streptomyces sp. WAC 01529 TaxID=2203205 RepID=UPI000F7123B6|nr:hypothetical protein [Streptomyces sp. WAC 01529]AZM51795.1 hypothetical protein DMA15_03685 [Streptomyces sp. WAC 01529]